MPLQGHSVSDRETAKISEAALSKTGCWALVEQNFTFFWIPGPNINEKGSFSMIFNKNPGWSLKDFKANLDGNTPPLDLKFASG